MDDLNNLDLSDFFSAVSVGRKTRKVENANDYYELMWSATDINMRLKAVSANGVVPAIPSVIVSVVSV